MRLPSGNQSGSTSVFGSKVKRVVVPRWNSINQRFDGWFSLPTWTATCLLSGESARRPLFFVSPGQINAQMPDDLSTGAQVLAVSPAGAPDVRAAFTLVRNAPGLFPVPVNGQAMAMAVHEDGSQVTSDAPARPGELLTVYGTGFGPAERPRPEGFPIPQTPSYNILDAVTLQAGTLVITAENAFAAVGRCGVDAVQFRLDGSVTGTVTLRVTVNGVDSNTLMLPVQ